MLRVPGILGGRREGEGEGGRVNIRSQHMVELLTLAMSSIAVGERVPIITRPMARPAASPITASSLVIKFSFKRSYTSNGGRRGGKGREGKGRGGKGRGGERREGKGREGKGRGGKEVR